MGIREERREDLRKRLIEAALARIEAGGLRGLRAREITADAGCALGALYQAFQDLDDLVLHVNSLTLARMDACLREAATSAPGARAILKALAAAYLAFARENRNLWAALFEHRMPDGVPVPEWHLREHAVLIHHIVGPLAMLQPSLDMQELAVRARTLFSAVHGIVAVSIEERFVGLVPAAVDLELERFLEVLVDGVERSRPVDDKTTGRD